MTPAPRGSLRAGFAALAQHKLILLLTVTTALLGGLAALALAPSLHGDLGGTLAGDHLIRNHPTFAPTDFVDFARERSAALDGTKRAAAGAGVVGVLLQVFLAGGIVSVLGRGRYSFGQFFEPARRNLVHNLKCLALFVLAVSILVGGWLGGAIGASKKLLADAPPDAASRTAAVWITVLVAALLFAVLSLLYDFARASRRYAPTIGAWRSIRFAFRVLDRAWPRALALFAFWLVLGGVSVLAAVAAAWALPSVSLPAIGLLALLQFAALWLRSAARVAAWGSYIGFLESRARRALAEMSSRSPVASLKLPEPVRQLET